MFMQRFRIIIPILISLAWSTVASAQAPPFIIQQPTSVTVCEGGPQAQFSVSYLSGGSVQWQQRNVTVIGSTFTTIADAPPFSGATTNTLTINPTSHAVADNYAYRARITNTGGSTFSNTVTISILASPTSPTAVNGESYVCGGQKNVRYSTSLITNALTYVWGVPPGATITSSGVTGSEAYIYVAFPIGNTNGNVTVYGQNPCGVSSTSSLTVSIGAHCGSKDQNYVVAKTITRDGVYEANGIGEQRRNVQENITYFDGLGRAVQRVYWQASPQFTDVVEPVDYDNLGRQNITYLPYVSSDKNSQFKENAIGLPDNYATSDHKLFYANGLTDKVQDDNAPYTETKFEPSPLNRIVKQGIAGTVWQPDQNINYNSTDLTRKSSWRTNSSSEVLIFDCDQTNSTYPLGLVSKPAQDSFLPNLLYKTLTKDEHGMEVIEFHDKTGKLLLQKVQVTGGLYAQTYYIYDVYNNLVCIIPPEAVKRMTDPVSQYFGKTELERNEFLAQYAFRYKYDGRRRVIEKQVPGAGPVYMIYDPLDRVVLVQDGKQRQQATPEWTFTKYDGLGRKIMTGKYPDASSRETVQLAVDNYYNNLGAGQGLFEQYIGSASGNILGYTNVSFPQVATESSYLSITYFDIYDLYIAPAGYGYSNDAALTGHPSSAATSVKGFPSVFILRNLTTNAWMRSVNYYDSKYRVTQSISDHRKGKLVTNNTYDFAGNVLQSRRIHTVNGSQTIVLESYTYDHTGRLVETSHKVGNNPAVVVSKNEYNGIGQLVAKKLHKTESAERVSVDPDVGQAGVLYSNEITSASFNAAQNKYIATSKITLTPGFVVSAGQTFHARIGYSQQDADAYNNQISDLYHQQIDYRYNIRGWLTRINDADVSALADNNLVHDYFGMEFRYNTPFSDLSSSPLYNGNISAVKWSKGNGGSVAKQAYTYQYDGMSRLLIGAHFDYAKTSLSWISNNDAYSENISYDLNGNINTLVRRGYQGSSMDNLEFNYSGNRLNYVHDTFSALEGFVNGNSGTDDYAYDDNGNLIKDRNKGINTNGDIKYNYLNLVDEVTKGTEKVRYIYDAAGTKLAQEAYNSSGSLIKTTDYIGDLVFENDVLKFVQHSEGRYLPTGSEYQYHLKDHLGSIRVSFTTKPQSTNSVSVNFENGDDGSFENYSSTTYDLVDHTDAGTTYQKVQWLNGGVNGRVGVGTSFSVMPGDEVTISAYAKYRNASGTGNLTSFATALATAFNVSAGSTGDGLKLFNSLNSFAAMVPQGDHQDDDEAAPKAFVTILFFDRNYNFLDAAWDQITTTGLQSSGSVKEPPHDFMSITAKAPEGGYAYVFVSNEHPYYVDVYVDDVTVSHTPSPIISSADYYPFGLSFNASDRENSLEQRHLYTGKELQDEMGLNWYDYGWRNYMPDIGRWGSIDGHAETYMPVSPYNYCFNSPVNLFDYLGLDPVYENGKYYDEIDGEKQEVSWDYVYSWMQTHDAIGTTYTLQSNGVGNHARVTKTEPGSAQNAFYYNGKRYIANSHATLMGTDGDRDDSVGDFYGIVTLSESDLVTILGHGSYVINHLYGGRTEDAMKAHSIGGKLDYKIVAFRLLGISSDALMEINGVVYNSNEAGNYLWGMVIEYHASLVSPNVVAEGGSRILSWRADERWEQKAVSAGRAFGLSLTKRDEEFKRWVLQRRLNARHEN